MNIIVGDHDQTDPAMSREMNAKIAGSTLVVLPDSEHMTFLAQPELVHPGDPRVRPLS